MSSPAPFHLLKLPTVVLSDVLDHLKISDICILRATSRKIKFVLKQSIERAKKRQSEDERWLSLSITARQYYLESECEVIFCRNLTDCEDISLYKGRDVNRVLETILDFLEHLKINKNLDITVLYYLEGDIQSIVELIARKTIKVNHLKFTGEGISKQLFRGLLESKANNLRVCVQRPHAIELSDIDDDLIDLMMCSSFVTLGRININSLHLNLLLKKWKENSHLEYFLAQMESHLDKSIILEGTNSRQQSQDDRFHRFENYEYLTCNKGTVSELTILPDSFRLSVPP